MIEYKIRVSVYFVTYLANMLKSFSGRDMISVKCHVMDVYQRLVPRCSVKKKITTCMYNQEYIINGFSALKVWKQERSLLDQT